MKMQWWNVTTPGARPFRFNGIDNTITEDSVPFGAGETEDDVKRSLIDHDGYPADIIVTKSS